MNIKSKQRMSIKPKKRMSIKSIVTSLHAPLISRKIETGKRLVPIHESMLSAVPPDSPLAPRLSYVLAGWAEYSAPAAAIARKLDLAYREKAWPKFSLAAWGEIMAGRASLALYENRIADVEAAWRWACANASHLSPEVLATIDFTMSRAGKKNKEYEPALDLVRSAIAGYQQAGFPGMVAVAKATEGWLLMQLRDLSGAAQSWEAAFSYLKTSEDWTVLGNIRLFEARGLCRADRENEGLIAFGEAAELYSKCVPPHRSLRRVLLELANLQHRLAFRETSLVRSKALCEAAEGHIQSAEQLLQDDPVDIRNHGRFLIALTNRWMCGLRRNLFHARGKAKEAFEFAEKHNDKVIAARARYKQAVIESRETEDERCENPVHRRLLACGFAVRALELASGFHSDRLAARLHTLLGNLFLAFPFRNQEYATREWESAAACMAKRGDRDYIVKQIEALGQKLSAPVPEGPPIFTVTALACHQALKMTLQDVERAIVLAAIDLLGKDATSNAIVNLLGVGHDRVDPYFPGKRKKLRKGKQKILSMPKAASEVSPRKQATVPAPGHDVIFRVKAALVFSQPLAKTLRIVERAVILSTWLYYQCDTTAAKNALHINWNRFSKELPSQ